MSGSGVHICALPGCGVHIEQVDDRPARLYCGVEHRRAARRLRAERAATPATRSRRRPVALAAELTHDRLVREAPRRATGRWREMAYGSEPSPPPGDGTDPQQRRAGLRRRAQAPLDGPHRIAVISLKGGVGKTTVAACLGLSLAEMRGDRVVALDGAPDPSTLADRLADPPTGSVRDLLRSRETVHSMSELSHYTALAGRLSVVASEQDPRAAPPLDGVDHSRATALLSRFYDIVITDCGTGLMHSAARNAVAEADSLIVVGAPALDGASRAAATLDWLAAHGHRAKARDAVVVLTRDRDSSQVRIDSVLAHFRARVRAVLEIPYDPHLVAGSRIVFEDLRHATADAFLELSALVGDRFGVATALPDGPEATAEGA